MGEQSIISSQIPSFDQEAHIIGELLTSLKVAIKAKQNINIDQAVIIFPQLAGLDQYLSYPLLQNAFSSTYRQSNKNVDLLMHKAPSAIIQTKDPYEELFQLFPKSRYFYYNFANLYFVHDLYTPLHQEVALVKKWLSQKIQKAKKNYL